MRPPAFPCCRVGPQGRLSANRTPHVNLTTQQRTDRGFHVARTGRSRGDAASEVAGSHCSRCAMRKRTQGASRCRFTFFLLCFHNHGSRRGLLSSALVLSCIHVKPSTWRSCHRGTHSSSLADPYPTLSQPRRNSLWPPHPCPAQRPGILEPALHPESEAVALSLSSSRPPIIYHLPLFSIP